MKMVKTQSYLSYNICLWFVVTHLSFGVSNSFAILSTERKREEGFEPIFFQSEPGFEINGLFWYRKVLLVIFSLEAGMAISSQIAKLSAG